MCMGCFRRGGTLLVQVSMVLNTFSAKEALPPVCVVSHEESPNENDLCHERNRDECQTC